MFLAAVGLLASAAHDGSAAVERLTSWPCLVAYTLVALVVLARPLRKR